MKALLLTANARLEVVDRPLPERPHRQWVLVRVAAAGICGSDIPRAFDGGAYHYPLVMGHEFAGVVEESFPGSTFCPGDRVAVFPLIPNSDERINEIGEYALGSRYDYFGSRRDGGFQELVWVPEFNLLPVPENVPLEHAAMTEPCAVALHAANRPSVRAGMSGAVIGAGPIGTMVGQWLRIAGCRPVVISEPDQRKRSIAEELGFLTIDPVATEPIGALQEATGGGADIVVEACGLPITMRQAIAAASLFGQVVLLGNPHGDAVLDESLYSSVLRRELTILGSWNSKVTPRGRDEWSRALSFLSRELYVEPLISHRIRWDEGPSVLRAIRNGEGWFNKVLFTVPELCT